MNCSHITTSCQMATSPSAFPRHALPNRAPVFTPTYLGAKLHVSPLRLACAKSRYRQPATVCLFGGKGKSDNWTEGFPWKALEKATGNFKKEQSVEDLLRQQIQKQDYYDDGGSGGKRPGGGDGNGDGFGEADDVGGTGDEFVQVICATVGFIFLYIYIIETEEINVFVKDLIKFIFTRQMSLRLRRLKDQLKMFFKWMTEKEEDDPDWLEREILRTPTWYDSPAKYRRIKQMVDARSDSRSYE